MKLILDLLVLWVLVQLPLGWCVGNYIGQLGDDGYDDEFGVDGTAYLDCYGAAAAAPAIRVGEKGDVLRS